MSSGHETAPNRLGVVIESAVPIRSVRGPMLDVLVENVLAALRAALQTDPTLAKELGAELVAVNDWGYGRRPAFAWPVPADGTATQEAGE